VPAAPPQAVLIQWVLLFFGLQRCPVPGYGIHAPTWAELETLITTSFAAYKCHTEPTGTDVGRVRQSAAASLSCVCVT
jgi:hypothetical protein